MGISPDPIDVQSCCSNSGPKIHDPEKQEYRIRISGTSVQIHPAQAFVLGNIYIEIEAESCELAIAPTWKNEM
jgi:hypothetical protein